MNQQSVRKKLPHTKSNINQKIILNTSIENLSNEIFYEIFDYLEACEIHQAFSNLNYRFQQLLNSSSLLFKIKIFVNSEQTLINYYEQINLLNRNQIFSIKVQLVMYIDGFFSLFPINSSLNHLQSLTLDYLGQETLMLVLPKLTSLPNLFSLTINLYNILNDLTDIYRIVFTLPVLKYYYFSIGSFSNLLVSLPIATDQQFSSIEYLNIDHCCTFEQLYTIISYTPQVHNLYFMHTDDDNLSFEIIFPITLSNLTRLVIYVLYLKFDQLEMLMSKPYLKLKAFTFSSQSEDMAYLNANRWEKLIIKSLPQLEKFYFRYNQHIDYENDCLIYLSEPNQFISPFWIERKWIFQAEIESEDIIYSIQPYRKQWYEYAQYPIINSSIQLSKSALLTFLYKPCDECREFVILDIESVLYVSQIYHLKLHEEKTTIGVLIDILFKLPKLVSLKMNSLSLSHPRFLHNNEADDFNWVSNTNKIKKVCLEKFERITEVYILIELCPRMNYLQIDCINIDVKLFLRKILKKIIDKDHRHLCSLGICVPMVDDKMIAKLEKMIKVKKLLDNFTIKRVTDKIYLQWY